MFSLIISIISIALIVFLTLSTLQYSKTTFNNEINLLDVFFKNILMFGSITAIIFLIISVSFAGFYYSHLKNKNIRLKEIQKEIKTSRSEKVEYILINSIINGRLHTSELEEVISVLKIGKSGRKELEENVKLKYLQKIAEEIEIDLKEKIGDN